MIAERSLDVPSREIFNYYSLFHLERIAVEIVCLFFRYAPLLSTYECICTWGLIHLGEKLTEDDLAEVERLQAAIPISRNKYVDGFGCAVTHAFYECLLIESQTTI